MNNNNIGTSQFLVYAAIIIIMIRILQKPTRIKMQSCCVQIRACGAARPGRRAQIDICHAHVTDILRAPRYSLVM